MKDPVVSSNCLKQQKWANRLYLKIKSQLCIASLKPDLVHGGPLCCTIGERPLPTMDITKLSPLVDREGGEEGVSLYNI